MLRGRPQDDCSMYEVPAHPARPGQRMRGRRRRRRAAPSLSAPCRSTAPAAAHQSLQRQGRGETQEYEAGSCGVSPSMSTHRLLTVAAEGGPGWDRSLAVAQQLGRDAPAGCSTTSWSCTGARLSMACGSTSCQRSAASLSGAPAAQSSRSAAGAASSCESPEWLPTNSQPATTCMSIIVSRRTLIFARCSATAVDPSLFSSCERC